MIGRAERAAGISADRRSWRCASPTWSASPASGGEVDVEELGHVAGRLAELAGDVAEQPVRLVKTIGDAAMFVSPDPAPLVGVALAWSSAIEEAELPPLRAGIALGPALQRSGDCSVTR